MISAVRIIFSCMVLFFAWPAEASELNAILAEQNRIRGQVRLLIKRSAWVGVNRQYEKLSNLSRPGAELNFRDHLHGAMASRELGNLEDTVERLAEAVELDPNAEESEWLEMLKSNTGSVKITNGRRMEGSLIIKDPPFEPEYQLAIKVAEQSLLKKGKFVGLLPVGEYLFGTQKFEVQPGIRSTVIISKGRGTTAGGSWITRLGVSSTYMGEATETPAPIPFTGGGPLLGVGYEHGFGTYRLIQELNLSVSAHPDAFLGGGHILSGVGLEIEYGLPFLGFVYDISYARRKGIIASDEDLAELCENCENPEEFLLKSIHAGYVSSFGPVFGFQFEATKNLSVDVRAGVRNDTARWYTWGECSLKVRLGG